MNDEYDRYLIWSNEHRAWWRHASQGYTPHIASAGNYSRAEAISICKGALYGSREVPNELPIRIDDAVAMGMGEFISKAVC